MKYKYSVVVNNMPVESEINTYLYKYGNTENIKLAISEDYFCISAEMTVDKKIDDIVISENPLFSDAIKKAMLIHIIKYSKNIDIKTVMFFKNDKQTKIFDSANGDVFVYSLVNGELFRKIPKSWDNPEFIQSILNQVKSNYDSRTAALFSYIISKSKVYESERLNYMWFAFNGMYSYFWNKKVKKYISGKIKNGDSEINQMAALMRVYDIPDGFPDRKSANLIAEDVQEIINKHWNGDNITKESLENGIHADLAKEINDLLYIRIDQNGKVFYSTKGRELKYYDGNNKDSIVITPYSYLFVLFPYHLRCDIVHANMPFKLFSYKEEPDIKSYRFASNMLENYIEENLIKWFDSEYIDGFLEEKAEKVAKDVKTK